MPRTTRPTPPSSTTPVEAPRPRGPSAAARAAAAAQADDGEGTVSVKAPADVAPAARKQVVKDAQDKLLGTVAKHKDVKGTGVETSGAGDPRITERRHAASTLLATGDAAVAAALDALGPAVRTDLRWLQDADRRDYDLDGSGQFAWSLSNMSNPAQMEAVFKDRVAAGRAQALAIEKGEKKTLDAQNGSVVGATFLQDPKLRAAALVDVLLQFRAPSDATKQDTGYSDEGRIDRVGPALVAEQRVLLNRAALGVDDPAQLRELALLREVVASHPTSSVNSIFDARNAVGSMKGDAHTADWDDALKWVESDVPPGATASGYKAIHHNFSKQTPQNIAKFVSEFVFRLGPEAERPILFGRIVDAMKVAFDGDYKAARELLKAIDKPEHRKVVAPLLKDVQACAPEQVDVVILDFLKKASMGDWAAFPTQYKLGVLEGKAARDVAQKLIGAHKSAVDGDVARARKVAADVAPTDGAAKVLEGLLQGLDAVAPAKLAEHVKALQERPEVKALPDAERVPLLDLLRGAASTASSYKPFADATVDAQNYVQAATWAQEVLTSLDGKPEADVAPALAAFLQKPEVAAKDSWDSPSRKLKTIKEAAEKRVAKDDVLKGLSGLAAAVKSVEDLVARMDGLKDDELHAALKDLEKSLDAPSGTAVPSELHDVVEKAWYPIKYDQKPAKFLECRSALRELVARAPVLTRLIADLQGKEPQEWPALVDGVVDGLDKIALPLSQQVALKADLEKVAQYTARAAPGVVARIKLKELVDAGALVQERLQRYAQLPEGEVKAAVQRDAKALVDEKGAKKHLKDALDAISYDLGNAGKADEAKAALTNHVARVTAFAPLVKGMAAAADGEVASVLKKFLDANLAKNLGENEASNLEMAARMYRAVCASQPTATSIEASLFKAGGAVPEVADVVARMTKGDAVGTLKELGEARLAMRDAIVAAKTGYDRHDLVLFDAQLSRLTCEELGASVDRVGDLKTNAERAEALVAVQTALRASVASGLHVLLDDGDPSAKKGRPLDVVLKDVDAAIAKGKLTETEYRAVMVDVALNVARTVQNIRSFIDVRAAELSDAGVAVDPEFLDQFVKASPLHYATALAEKGMRTGLKERVLKGTDGRVRGVENVAGMRVLNGIGPVVFKSAVQAENGKDLARIGPSKDQLAILYQLEEKKMVAVGGLFVDTAHAPGGNSHLNMYAMNNGIPVVALPELRTRYADFFKTAESEGGIYLDDTGAEFKMTTVDYAIEKGLIKAGDVDKLRPGMNRNITFLKPTSDATSFTVAATHDATISAQRGTRDVEIYLPQDEVKSIGKTCPTWEELATLGIHARHLAGEKGTVLALLSAHPELGKYVPKGSQVTPAVIKGMLGVAQDAAGETLLQKWQKVWTDDPAVGVVDDKNFLQSAFYTDPAYRRATRERLQHETKDLLTQALLKADGTLSADGDRVYQQLVRNPALANDPMWILRSSFTAEDRPGKSGAGQYESFVDKKLLTDAEKDAAKPIHAAVDAAQKDVDAAAAKVKAGGADAAAAQQALDAAQKKLDAAVAARNALLGPARVKALIGVIESTWMPEPIENNVAEQFFLKHVGPTVAVQQTVDPDISGVMISRNLETGGRQEVSFQLVPGFGGGVEGGKTTEGIIGSAGARVAITNGGPAKDQNVVVGDVAVTPESMKELRDIVLKTEKYFNEVVEKGKRYAVDMEVARDKVDGWKIVQARVILVDK